MRDVRRRRGAGPITFCDVDAAFIAVRNAHNCGSASAPMHSWLSVGFVSVGIRRWWCVDCWPQREGETEHGLPTDAGIAKGFFSKRDRPHADALVASTRTPEPRASRVRGTDLSGRRSVTWVSLAVRPTSARAASDAVRYRREKRGRLRFEKRGRPAMVEPRQGVGTVRSSGRYARLGTSVQPIGPYLRQPAFKSHVVAGRTMRGR